MNIYKSFEEIDYNSNSIITIGTFDGVHKGHRFIIAELKRLAKMYDLRPVVITFDPHPQIVLNKRPGNPVRLITSLEEKIILLGSCSVSNLIVVNFTKEFSQLSPQSFIEDILLKKVGMKSLLIGHDHMIGRDRSGNGHVLTELGLKNNFTVEKVKQYNLNSVSISSTKIRTALGKSNMELVNSMLGYPYIVIGTVIHGDARGASLGFPTANISVNNPNKIIPPDGVYLVTVEVDNKKYWGMANLGTRPTFKREFNKVLEVNIFNFNTDIYKEAVIVSFHEFLRHEKKFGNSEELLAQIRNDKKNCMELIKKLSN